MKRIWKNIDIFYFIGLGLIIIGSVLLIRNPGTVFKVINVVINSSVIFVGGVIITYELILTKDYKRLFHYLIANIKQGTTQYVLIISLLAFLLSWFVLSPFVSFILLLSLLLIYVIYVLIVKSTKLNFVVLAVIVLVITRHFLKLSGYENYERADKLIYDGTILIYIAFIITVIIVALKKTQRFSLGLAGKILLTLLFINFMTFLVQYRVFNIEYYHSQEDITVYESTVINSDSCPTGYGYQVIDRNSNSFRCIELKTPLVSLRENSVGYLAFIYSSLVLFSLVYSSLAFEAPKNQKCNKESVAKMTGFISNRSETKE